MSDLQLDFVHGVLKKNYFDQIGKLKWVIKLHSNVACSMELHRDWRANNTQFKFNYSFQILFQYHR